MARKKSAPREANSLPAVAVAEAMSGSDPQQISLPQRALILLFGCLLSAWLARGFFAFPADTIHHTHEKHTYPPRLVEFRDALSHGVLSPQWCPHFWGGLGSPYFSYYQPGFFYVASLTPWNVPTVRALGVTVFAFALVGYGGMFCFVRRWFGPAAGTLSATAMLLSVYVGTNLYVRGDLTEFAGMMLLPVALAAIAGFLEEGGRVRAGLVALSGAAIIITHPCVALMAYPVLALAAAAWGIAWAGWKRGLAAVAALGLGGLLASFYAWPALLETGLTYSERAFTNFYDFHKHFLPWSRLVSRYDDADPIPATLGFVIPLLAIVHLVVLACRWRQTTVQQRSAILVLAAATLASLFLMTEESTLAWEGLPLLDHLQFPWRFLAVASVGLSALAGMMLPWRRPRARLTVMLVAVMALCATAPWAAPLAPLDPPRPIAETVDDLLRNTFIPDANFEWLPKTAQPLMPDTVSVAILTPAGCQLDDFLVEQERVAARVKYPAGGPVVLRHFYFAAGWRATLDGQFIELQSSPLGLMQVDLRPGAEGLLEVKFHGTPMRLWGWYVTLLSCLPLAVLLAPRRVAELLSGWRRAS